MRRSVPSEQLGPVAKWTLLIVLGVACFLAVPSLAGATGPLPRSEPALATQEQAAPQAQDLAARSARAIDPEVSSAELVHLLTPLTKAELEAVARDWQMIVKDKTQEIADLQVARLKEGNKVDTDRMSRLVALVELRARLLERFVLVVDALERKGGDPDLVGEMRAYRKAILFEETSQAGVKALVGSLREWAGRTDGGGAVLMKIAFAGLALLACALAARLLRSLAQLWLGRSSRMSRLLQGFVAAVVFWLALLVGLGIVLASVDVDITPMFAVLGGASFILAFAFQDTLGNLASGLMIMINQPFDEGDFIEVGGVAGTVRKVTMVGTTVATPDNRIVIVPNKSVWGNVIVNASASDVRRIDLVFSASYDDPIQQVLEVISQCVSEHPQVLPDPPAEIRPSELGASAVNYVCRPWVRADDYWKVHCDLTQGVKEAFDRHGLSMPFPQQDIRVLSWRPLDRP